MQPRDCDATLARGASVVSVTPTPTRTRAASRSQLTFGGIVPSAATVEGDTVLASVLAVEMHSDGAVLPLLVLSEASGVLGWDLPTGLSVTDDAGRDYAVEQVAGSSGLGALAATAWIEPAPPPEARTLALTLDGLTRTVASRRGGLERPLTPEPLSLELDLVPERTAAEVPEEPELPVGERPAGRAPARARTSFAGLVPIGQARLDPDGAVCLWALERYRDRSVLTVAALADEPVRLEAMAPGSGQADLWDDRGNRYGAVPVHGASQAGWMEASLEVTPAIDPAARVLAVRLSRLPATAEGRADPPLAGPFTFGVTLPPT